MIITTDDYKDIYIWKLEVAKPAWLRVVQALKKYNNEIDNNNNNKK